MQSPPTNSRAWGNFWTVKVNEAKHDFVISGADNPTQCYYKGAVGIQYSYGLHFLNFGAKYLF